MQDQPDRGDDLGLPARPAPLFLAQRAYRRRRMADAVRLLPVLGIVFFFLPILWEPADTPTPDTARGWIWLFLAWAGLICLAFLLSRGLARTEERGRGDGT